jgi:hypothetical protein
MGERDDVALAPSNKPKAILLWVLRGEEKMEWLILTLIVALVMYGSGRKVQKIQLIAMAGPLIIFAYLLNRLLRAAPMLTQLFWQIYLPIALVALVVLFVFGPMIHRKAEQQRAQEMND